MRWVTSSPTCALYVLLFIEMSNLPGMNIDPQRGSLHMMPPPRDAIKLPPPPSAVSPWRQGDGDR